MRSTEEEEELVPSDESLPPIREVNQEEHALMIEEARRIVGEQRNHEFNNLMNTEVIQPSINVLDQIPLIQTSNGIGLTHNVLEQMPLVQSLIQNKNKTQLEFYKENNASEIIQQFVDMPGKTFGEKCMEPIAKDHFHLDSRTDSGHDHKKIEKKIEQKSARYHANGDDFKWQHIEMTHDFDFLLLTGLDFNEILNFIGSRKIVEELIEQGIITGQGKKNDDGVAVPQQGYWFSRSQFANKNMIFEDYFRQIKCEQDLIDYINEDN